MKKAAIYLPFFCGFYESWFEPNGEYLQQDSEEQFLEQDENPNRDKERLEEAFERADIWKYFDNNKYEKEIGAQFTDILNDKICPEDDGEFSFLNGVKYFYESIQSPKFYNFETDKIESYVEMEDNSYISLMTYLATNCDDFDAYLKERYSSRDGFCSFVPNNYNDFITEMTCDESLQMDKDRDLSIALEFVLERYFEQEYGWEEEWAIMRELAQTTQEDLTETEFFDFNGWASEVENEYNRLRLGL